MADIVLRDKYDNNMTYEDVKHIRVKGNDGVYNQFSLLKSLYLYAVQPTGGKYKVIKKFTQYANNQFWWFGVSENDLKEWGYQLSGDIYASEFIITRNAELEVGQEYGSDSFY